MLLKLRWHWLQLRWMIADWTDNNAWMRDCVAEAIVLKCLMTRRVK
jgi:hypothetical protein